MPRMRLRSVKVHSGYPGTFNFDHIHTGVAYATPEPHLDGDVIHASASVMRATLELARLIQMVSSGEEWLARSRQSCCIHQKKPLVLRLALWTRERTPRSRSTGAGADTSQTSSGGGRRSHWCHPTSPRARSLKALPLEGGVRGALALFRPTQPHPQNEQRK